MKAEYDPEAKALYVYFDRPDAHKPQAVKRTEQIGEVAAYIDWGYDWQVIGVEFIGVQDVEAPTGSERKYTVVVEESEGWLIGSIEGKPGYVTQGRDTKELFTNVGEVITLMEEDED